MTGFLSPAADFSNSFADAAFLTVNRVGLIGEFLYTRNLLTSRVNSAGLKANAVEQLNGGPPVPVYGDHQVELGNGAGHDTSVSAPASAQTIVLVVAPQIVDATTIAYQGFMAGSSAPSINGRLTLALQPGAGVLNCIIADSSSTTLSTANPLARPFSDFRCIIVSLSGSAQGSTLTVGEYKAGLLVQQASAPIVAARTAPTGTLVTGSGSAFASGSGYNQRQLFAARLDYSRELSVAEKLAVYLELRAYLAPWKAI